MGQKLIEGSNPFVSAITFHLQRVNTGFGHGVLPMLYHADL